MKTNNLIKKLRLEKGFSQEELAELLNLEVSAYGRIERGDTDLKFDVLQKILKELGCRIEDFITQLELESNQYFNYQDSNNNQNNVTNSTEHIEFIVKEYKDLISDYKSQIIDLKKEIDLLKKTN